MKLLTEKIISKLEAHPIGPQDGKGLNTEVLVKYPPPAAAEHGTHHHGRA